MAAPADAHLSHVHVESLQLAGQHRSLGGHEAPMHGALEALEVLLRLCLLAERAQVVAQCADNLIDRSAILGHGRALAAMR